MRHFLIMAAVVVFAPVGFAQKTSNLPFMNPQLSVGQRVADLVGRMTLEEKIGQMMHAAPAIERLGIPEYNWWNECLHGVARAGLATVFPQAIGLGATWDEDLMFRISTAISDEARAKHHDFARKGKRYIYEGLTFWSPNINIFRDPRWGRGQETYGEDPFLTGRMAVQFIKGLQGDDPNYFKVIATVKHFAVHSGPEPERHSFDAIPDERDFRETYLPQFEMGIKEGGAFSVMCAYNRVREEACCGSNLLLTTILRSEWGFRGYVVSDCGAIRDIYQRHKIAGTPAKAAAIAVRSGCDLECGSTYEHLKEALRGKLISEQEIDTAVTRLFTARFRLGMFDPPELVPYTKIPYDVVDSKGHKDLALEAARESIVLLKNANHLLPLSKNIGTVAVIGPNADDRMMLLGNYNGTPSDPVTPLRGIREKLSGRSKILFARGCELAAGLPSFEVVPPQVLSHGAGAPGLAVDYYSNRDFSGPVLFSSVDLTLDANWRDKSPRPDMDDDNFGVRWSGELTPKKSGTYQLGIITTCKVNLWLNDSIIANTSYHFRDEFGDPRLRKSPPISLEGGKKYNLMVEAGESYGDAQVQLLWSIPKDDRGTELAAEALEAARHADAVILCMGLSAQIEGEEMNLDIDGFRGGDRTRLDLPDVQQKLLKEVQALGKPIVLVLLNGSALAINWERVNIPAIIEAWYPGQAGGYAIADVLFGDYNPGGRLPVTFYKALEELLPFEEYGMAGRTYRYFHGEPLYPFGYGLSYTSFTYDHLRTVSDAKVGDSINIAVNVRNAGERGGDEVVQLYVSNLTASIPVPIRSLKGFRRVHLSSGETKTIEFTLPPDAFTIIDNRNDRVILPGEYEISVGGGQPESRAGATGPGVLSVRIRLL